VPGLLPDQECHLSPIRLSLVAGAALRRDVEQGSKGEGGTLVFK
jgi:hypothetical protein